MASRTSKKTLTIAFGGLLCGHLMSCHVPGLIPETRTPADRAHEVIARCSGFDEASVARSLAPHAFDSVEPSYSYVKSGPNDREPRLRGARIQIKPLPGFSPEALTRGLECHEARVTLGTVTAPVADPYVLPGDWLDIRVDSTGDGFVVSIQTDEIDAARRVLDRARQFSRTDARSLTGVPLN